jgi:hypothetical protein
MVSSPLWLPIEPNGPFALHLRRFWPLFLTNRQEPKTSPAEQHPRGEAPKRTYHRASLRELPGCGCRPSKEYARLMPILLTNCGISCDDTCRPCIFCVSASRDAVGTPRAACPATSLRSFGASPQSPAALPEVCQAASGRWQPSWSGPAAGHSRRRARRRVNGSGQTPAHAPLRRANTRSSWRNGTIALRLYRAGERAWRLGGLIHRRPCRQRVHVISPAHDLAILDRGDRHESIVVGRIVGEYSSMHLVFECHHPPIVGRMHEQ